MTISPIGTGIGGVGFSGSGSIGSGGGKNSIQQKIDTLEKQKKEFEDAKSKTGSDKAIDSKIESLERRIENLQTRLDKLSGEKKDGECQTCKERKYQDGSDDPGVSFKSATKVSPEAADAAVRGHEMEHVYRNRAEAAREGREVVSQSVSIKRAICPECGKAYTSGGVTKTVTKPKQDNADKFNVGRTDTQNGKLFDHVA